MKKTLFLLVTFSIGVARQQQTIVSAFDAAAREFNVPSDVLKGIAFAETRWDQLSWPEGDTASACTGMPRPYGIMSLWDNQYFGHSLRVAASLIHKDPSILKSDLVQNIRGAAALLRKYHDELPLPEGTISADIESWRNAIAAYSGLPQEDLAQQHALDIYSQMSVGYHRYHIDWDKRPVNLAPIRAAVAKVRADAQATKLFKGGLGAKIENQPDYPLALWAPSYPGHWYTSGGARNFVVINDMEGYYLSTISMFQTQSASASVYYCVNSGYQPDGRPGGEVTQMVEEKYWAWHVRCWNSYMFGIEHEGFVNKAAWYTDDMYKSSAQLTSYLCKKYGIPVDRNHIIAHGEWQNPAWIAWMGSNYPGIDATCNDHTDPGPNWDWNYYISLVRGVRVVSTYPLANGANIPCYKDLVIHFSGGMDSASVVSAFSASPSLTGTFTWSDDYTTLRFHPDSLLRFSTTYTVTIDSTAKDQLSGRFLDGTGSGNGPSQFHLSFVTVPLDTTPPAITEAYPATTTTDFPLTGEAMFVFDEPLNAASAVAALSVRDSANNPVTPVTVQVDSVAGLGYLSLSSPSFKTNARYALTLSPGVSDLYGNATTTTRTVNFKTGPDVVTEGSVFEQFESNTRAWIQPSQNASSTLIDPAGTQFSFDPGEKRGGSSAGKLTYAFTQGAGGAAFLQVGAIPSIDSYTGLGVWVYGDGSRNEIDFVFNPSNQVFALDSLTWWGWKFLNIRLSDVTGPSKQFQSFVIRQRVGGRTWGTVYFDNMQLNAVVNDVRRPEALPFHFSLRQNYPNPFNPTTLIQYEVPGDVRVVLSVYNVLGQRVRTIVDAVRTPGIYQATFDATGLSSGIYFCRLEADRFRDTKKMVILR